MKKYFWLGIIGLGGLVIACGKEVCVMGMGGCDFHVDSQSSRSVLSEAVCKSQPGRDWHWALQKCIVAPRTDQECIDLGGGNLITEGKNRCCRVPNTYAACFSI